MACSSSLKLSPLAAISTAESGSAFCAIVSQRRQVGACLLAAGHAAWMNGNCAKSRGRRTGLPDASNCGLATGQNRSRSSSKLAKPDGGAKA
jgi:hypothetical protein